MMLNAVEKQKVEEASAAVLFFFFFFFNDSFWLCQVFVWAPQLLFPAACAILVPLLGIKPKCPVLQDGFLTTGPPGITNSRSLLRLMPIELVMLSNHLILCCPLLLLPSIFPSNRVFSNELVPQHQVAKLLGLQLQQQSFQSLFRVDFLQN